MPKRPSYTRTPPLEQIENVCRAQYRRIMATLWHGPEFRNNKGTVKGATPWDLEELEARRRRARFGPELVTYEKRELCL